MTRTTRAMLAGAMALGLLLSGCGGDDGKEDAAPKLTAQQQWAKSLCESLAPTTEAVEPPATEGDAAEAKKQVTTFLQTLNDRIAQQQKALTDAGAPPDASAEAYEAAQQQLATANETLSDVLKRFKKADAKDAESLQATLVQVGETLANSASFRGPLAELGAQDAALQKTIQDTEACASMLDS